MVSVDEFFACESSHSKIARYSEQITTYTALAVAVLSVCGSSFVILHFLLRSRGLFLSYLIFFLSIGDLGGSLEIVITNSWLVIAQYDGTTCKVWRSIFQFFELSTFFWSSCIAIYLFVTIVQESTIFTPKRVTHTFNTGLTNQSISDYQFPIYGSTRYNSRVNWITPTSVLILFGIVSWGVPLIMDIVLLAAGLYIVTPEGWCHPEEPYGQVVFWVAPMLVCFSFNLIMYIWISISLKYKQMNNPGPGMARLTSVVRKRVSLYLLVFLVCWAPDLAGELLGMFSSCYVYWYSIVPAFATPAQGFLNCLVYTLANPDIRKFFSFSSILFAFVMAPIFLIPVTIYCGLFKLGICRHTPSSEEWAPNLPLSLAQVQVAKVKSVYGEEEASEYEDEDEEATTAPVEYMYE